jgi:hypothetical protein
MSFLFNNQRYAVQRLGRTLTFVNSVDGDQVVRRFKPLEWVIPTTFVPLYDVYSLLRGVDLQGVDKVAIQYAVGGHTMDFDMTRLHTA